MAVNGNGNPIVRDERAKSPNNTVGLTMITIVLVAGLVSIVLVAILVPESTSIAIIASIATFVGLGIPIIMALSKVDDVHKVVNSKMSEMLNLQASSSYRAGIEEGMRAANVVSAQQAVSLAERMAAKTAADNAVTIAQLSAQIAMSQPAVASGVLSAVHQKLVEPVADDPEIILTQEVKPSDPRYIPPAGATKK